MPIYAYKCASCGHAKDVLQKMSDAPLTDCPACGKPTFSKQVTAAGFQLKGSGWYVTDFRGGSGGAAAPAADGAKTEGAKTDGTQTDGGKTDAKPADSKPADAKSPDSGTKAATTPAASSGGSGTS